MSAPLGHKISGYNAELNSHHERNNDYLCYLDQASFVGLRALKRQPLIVLTWIFPQSIDKYTVERLNARLAQGLLGRLVQRSPFRWGRHRWIANPIPEKIKWFREPISTTQLMNSRQSIAQLHIDPEYGPGWRLAVQPLADGGTALFLIVSHTIADAGAILQALKNTVTESMIPHQYATPSQRWSIATVAHDMSEFVRTIPELVKAIRSFIQRGSNFQAIPLNQLKEEKIDIAPEEDTAVITPHVQMTFNSDVLRRYANQLGIRLNIFLCLYLIQMARRIGRVSAEGRVNLTLPVSDRSANDTRGNALRSLSILIDPDQILNNPVQFQKEISERLSIVRENGDTLAPFLPLAPYIPFQIVRRLEKYSLKINRPIGCSLVGELDQELMAICGTANSLHISTLESFKLSELNAIGGLLFAVETQKNDKLFLSISGYSPPSLTNWAELVACARGALVDMGVPDDACLQIV